MKPIKLIFCYLIFFVIHGFYYCTMLNLYHEQNYHYIELQNRKQILKYKIVQILHSKNYQNNFESMKSYTILKKIKNNKKSK